MKMDTPIKSHTTYFSSPNNPGNIYEVTRYYPIKEGGSCDIVIYKLNYNEKKWEHKGHFYFNSVDDMEKEYQSYCKQMCYIRGFRCTETFPVIVPPGGSDPIDYNEVFNNTYVKK